MSPEERKVLERFRDETIELRDFAAEMLADDSPEWRRYADAVSVADEFIEDGWADE